MENSAALFGWIQSFVKVDWSRARGCCSKDEFFHEVRRTAKTYAAVATIPHKPRIAGYYYSCDFPTPGNGEVLSQLVDRFCPATPIDRTLIEAAFVTPMWGGSAGGRPAFVITSDGRGRGKSTLGEMIGELYGGVISFRKNEDAGVIAQRLLSSKGRDKRIVFLDNLKSRNFSWAELESLITAPTISGKQLYVGEGARPNDITYLISVNDAQFSTDMSQRSVFISLKKPDHDPKWKTETRQFIEKNRAALIADILGVLQRLPKALPKYGRWSEWERCVLARLRGAGDAQHVILERQEDADTEHEMAVALEVHVDQMLRKHGYDPTKRRIRIPAATMTSWFNAATGGEANSITVGMRLRQMLNEGRLTRLKKSESKRHKRHYEWVGKLATEKTKAVEFKWKKPGRGD